MQKTLKLFFCTGGEPIILIGTLKTGYKLLYFLARYWGKSLGLCPYAHLSGFSLFIPSLKNIRLDFRKIILSSVYIWSNFSEINLACCTSDQTLLKLYLACCASGRSFLKLYLACCTSDQSFLKLYLACCTPDQTFLKLYLACCISNPTFLKLYLAIVHPINFSEIIPSLLYI